MTTFHYDNHSKSSGVYAIFNARNWKIYVGSTKCFQVRWFQHVSQLRLGKHQNKHLQASWNKWGPDAFEFHVLEHNLPDKQERLTREETWISRHYENDKCFNNSPYAISREGCLDIGKRKIRKDKGEKRKPLSEETKKKLRDINIGKKHSVETRLKQSVVKLGKKMTEESRMKLSNARKGKPFHPNSSRLGKKHSTESKKKMSFAHKNITKETRQKMSLSHLGKPRGKKFTQ